MKKRILILVKIYAVVLMAGIAYGAAVTYLHIGIPCIFREMTSLSCPGCGNTRAALALLRLDLSEAVKANLLAPAEFAYLAYVAVYLSVRYIKDGILAEPAPKLLNYIAAAAVLIWTAVRNILGI